ncbi:oxidoreductase [Actinoplanes sichuanensis]|uniref:Aldo/keto reductase n=1 Tax=Actinoplanes sichuanensis TaxID=512349 RepID=A0ABW4A7L7_9ACTN|nr:aldo/keto reductase [Actinoplanes sichuanensis]BEL09384.1 oxidoreductase [Actinoplanes sichuanensis]
MTVERIDASVAGQWRLGDRVVNRMGFGSMRLTVRDDRELAVRVLRRAVELGVDHIDTAAFYFSPGGILDGEAGAVRYAAELIRDGLRPYPQGLFIATKVGPDRLPDGSWGEAVTAERLRHQVEENLRRLGVDTLDLVNLRIVRPAGPEEIAERFGILAEMRAEGLIRNLGLSNVHWEHVDVARRIAPVVCVQNAFAVDLLRHFDLLRKCGAEGIAFVPFFTIAGATRESGPPPRAAIEASTAHKPSTAGDPSMPRKAEAPRKTEMAREAETRRKTEAAGKTEAARAAEAGREAETGWEAGPEWRIAAARGVTGHQVRLAWTLQQGDHVLAIPGTGDVAHLEANVAAGALRLTAEEMAEMDQRR